MKKILFITSTNLAANPRLVKELRLAVDNGFACTVLQFSLGNWSDAATKALMNEFNKVRFVQLSALRKPFFPWLLSTLLERLFSLIPYSLLTTRMLSIAVSKRTFLLLRQIPKLQNEPYDWVIAHNPPAFYPALVAARQFGARLGIDVEDYHPGETTVISSQHRMRTFMRRILPKADYCSFAAPLIMAEVQKDIPEMPERQLVILNGFPQNEFEKPQLNSESVLKIIWFSQHVAAGRGLENVIPVVNKLYPMVELHLAGALSAEFEKMYLRDQSGVVLHGTLSQRELHQILGEFDVGLATDLPINRNREIALTNKIIAYAQAGLVIAAMHTEAQDQFLQSSGLYFTQMEDTRDSIEKILLRLFQEKVANKFDPLKQYETARRFSWEEVSSPLLEIWNSAGRF